MSNSSTTSGLESLANRHPRSKGKKGTPNKGQEYEIFLPALFTLIFYEDPSIEDFVLSSNVDNCGIFDDIVITLKTSGSKIEQYAFQLKHKEKQNVEIQPKWLQEQHKKNDFFILKYCESFSTIPNRDEYNYIIYTNAHFKGCFEAVTELGIERPGVCPGKKHFFLPSTSDGDANIFNFKINSRTQYTDQASESVYESFFQKFAIYTNQWHSREIQNLVIIKFGQIFQNQSLAMGFINIFTLWKLHEYTNLEISKKNLSIKILELVLSPHIVTPSCSPTDNMFSLLAAAIKKFDFTIINGLKDEDITTILSKPNFPDILRVGKDWKFLTKDISVADFNAQLEEETKYKIAYYLKEQPIIVRINECNKAGIVTTILKLKTNHHALHFVMTGTQIDKIDFPGHSTFSTLYDLLNREPNIFHQLIKELKINFLSNVYTYGDLFGVDDEVAKAITVKDIHAMLSNTYTIGFNLEKLPNPYISRSILTPIIKMESIDEISGDLLIITYKDNIKITDSLQKYLVKRTFMNVDDYLKADEVSPELVLYKPKLTKDNFEQIHQKNLGKNIHHLQVYNEEFLEWISTKGSREELKKCELTKSSSVNESDIYDRFQNNTNVIVARRGMGKSQMLKKLHNTCPLDLFPIKIILKEHGDFFNCDATGDEILSHFLSQEGEGKILAKVKNYFAKWKKIIFFFDGLDELPCKNIKTALHYIQKLSNMGYRIWLSSTPNWLEDIESQLDVFVSEMEGFNIEQQKQYIRERLQGKTVDVEDSIAQIFANIGTIVENTDILDVPLQLFMITDILIENSCQVNSNMFILTKMFQHFISGRYKHFFNKTKCTHLAALEEILNDSRIFRMDQYQIAGLKSCLDPDEFGVLNLCNHKKFLQQIETGRDFLGIIYKIAGNVVIFNQNINAEYFAALWFVENYNDINQSFLQGVLFKEKNRRIRLLFDMILAEDHPAHIAIIYRKIGDLRLVDESVANSTDKAGRIALHLASSHGYSCPILDDAQEGRILTDGTINKMKTIDGECRAIFKHLLKTGQDPLQEDHLFRWNSLNYCDKSVFLLPLEILLEEHTSNCDISSLDIFKNHKWTILFYSALLNYPRLFRKTFDEGGLKPDKIKRLLYSAITWNNWKIVNIILEKKVYVESITKNRRTPLHVASLNGHRDIVRLLLFKDAQVDSVDQYRRTALHLAAANNHMAVIRELFDYNPAVNPTDKYGRTPLHLAVEKGNKTIVQFLLDKKKADIDRPASNGWSPLHEAVIEGHVEIVKMLLEREASFDDMDEYGTKPVHIAAKRRSVPILEILLDKINNVDDLTKDKRTSLHLAAEFGNLEGLKLLLEKGAVLNSTDGYGRTALFWAVIGGRFRIVKFLLGHEDIKVDIVDNNGRNCLHWAAEMGQINIVKELLKKMGTFVNKQSHNGSTALHWAAQNGYNDIVDLLLLNGAEIDLLDGEGRSCLYWAALAAQGKTVQHLLKKGASQVYISGKSAIDYVKDSKK